MIYLVRIKIIKEFGSLKLTDVGNPRNAVISLCRLAGAQQALHLRHLETMASLFATSGPTRTSPLEIRSTKPGTKGKKLSANLVVKSEFAND